MAASVTCALLDCTQLSCSRTPASVRRFDSLSSERSIVCKSQRNSRYEKSKKHARQGQATIPQHGAMVPSKLRSGPAPSTQAKTKPDLEAWKERGSSQSEQEHREESSFDPQTLSVSATVAEEMQPTAKETSLETPSQTFAEEPQPAQEATEKPSGSHWDDFWAPRLFWVFRALGTVVD